jgi:hypothetical protein
MPIAVRAVGSDSSPADIAKLIDEDGCVVIADLASLETMDQIRAELQPHLAATGEGNTDFLGEITQRTGANTKAGSARRCRFRTPNATQWPSLSWSAVRPSPSGRDDPQT